LGGRSANVLRIHRQGFSYNNDEIISSERSRCVGMKDMGLIQETVGLGHVGEDVDIWVYTRFGGFGG
jgi:hypothetical protein